MTFGSCPRERELADLLHRGHWPHACSAELRSHVEGCRSCQGLAALTQAFQQARTQSAGAARLQSPGALWWRAQLRRRNAAIERMGRPLLGAQIFAVAMSVLVSGVFLLSQLKRGLGWISWFRELPHALHLEALLPDALQKYPSAGWMVIVLFALCAAMSGVIVYVASERN